jgi:hypothetical protein
MSLEMVYGMLGAHFGSYKIIISNSKRVRSALRYILGG